MLESTFPDHAILGSMGFQPGEIILVAQGLSCLHHGLKSQSFSYLCSRSWLRWGFDLWKLHFHVCFGRFRYSFLDSFEDFESWKFCLNSVTGLQEYFDHQLSADFDLLDSSECFELDSVDHSLSHAVINQQSQIFHLKDQPNDFLSYLQTSLSMSSFQPQLQKWELHWKSIVWTNLWQSSSFAHSLQVWADHLQSCPIGCQLCHIPRNQVWRALLLSGRKHFFCLSCWPSASDNDVQSLLENVFSYHWMRLLRSVAVLR